jgi:CrcB protein
MRQLLLIGLGGALGALLRYGLTGLVHPGTGSSFPWGTLGANLTGCFVIGLLWVTAEEGLLPPWFHTFMFIGLLGAFTTFSTYGLETVHLLRGGEIGPAITNIALSSGLGVPLAIGGIVLGRYVLTLAR